MVQHHPEIDLLTDFAAGSLAYGYSLCVAVHLESCAQCQQRVRELSALGGELLHELAPASVDMGSFDKLMAEIDNQPAPRSKPQIKPVPGVPRAMRKLAPAGLDALPWKRVTGSIQSADLPVGNAGSLVSLIRMAPGGTVGEHGHAGDELTVVLRGGFSDAEGVYLPGDFVALGEDHEHKPVAHHNEECICLTAQTGPIQFLGFWSRMLNPWLRLKEYETPR